MGTSCLVVVNAARDELAAQLADRGAARVRELERLWSRFLPGSEVSRLRGLDGSPAIVSDETYLLVERAVEAWRLTGGRYDPTVLDAVEANGYDRTFGDVPADRARPLPAVHRAPGCAGFRLDRAIHAVTLPPGVGIDPGGIGKGLTADLVAGDVMAAGAAGVLVDIGGDVRVAGAGPDDGAWVVDVDHPLEPDRPLLHLAIADAAIATSSRLRRRWTISGEPRHHLIDPRTGRPTETDVVAATVVAPEAWLAEALTKSVFVSGELDGLPAAASGLVVRGDGSWRASGMLRELVA
jgi:thiamine biosynthesis lipoprotein